ncbi:urease accessory protein UreD [Ferrovum sp. JA12]|uniref:urease accessory protein UreD n=1 Tax=Ferrovum sp. JA12 TaxID=1356299 RepID=UPI000703B402|nr:urease accessory protein UreD [Ferrovum sp. JA12]KRH78224.1 urease accessory protein UreD [Ferrovum sp. JA12]HQT81904.1 urease accessory protein UreD [Ferrovaceae bacterium]HQU05788.1 urease accessory protein UreD [Ferrovaceae bacterium]
MSFDFAQNKSRLLSKRHYGPLRIQKTLYPEGDKICHVILLHPPGGVAGGDSLTISLDVQQGAHVLATQPGATKWYKSAGLSAKQDIFIRLSEESTLEWLPQENIFFDNTKSTITTSVELTKNSIFFTWDINCFGRRLSNETFKQGELSTRYRIKLEDKWLLNEQGFFLGTDSFMNSPVGMAKKSVWATFMVYHPLLTPELMIECRQLVAEEKESFVGLTLNNGILFARYLGDSSESAKNYFITLWQFLRPILSVGQPNSPRIWRT